MDLFLWISMKHFSVIPMGLLASMKHLPVIPMGLYETFPGYSYGLIGYYEAFARSSFGPFMKKHFLITPMHVWLIPIDLFLWACDGLRI